MPVPTPAGSGRSRGQATVELALAFPIVVLAVLLVLQLALVGRDLILVTHAAREAARAAAVTAGAAGASRGARDATTALDPARLDIDVRRHGDAVTVALRYQSVTGLPIVGALVPDPVLRSEATMRDER